MSVFSGIFARLACSLARFSIQGGEEEEQKEQVQVRGYTCKQARTRSVLTQIIYHNVL
jgi:hypothetical protein